MFSGWIIEQGVDYFLYFLILIVTLFAVRPLIEPQVKGNIVQMNYRIRVRKVKTQNALKDAQESNLLIRHIKLLLQTVSNSRSNNYTTTFILGSFILFFFTFTLIVINLHDVIVAALIGAFTGLIPYLLLRIRLRAIQTSVGNELTPIVQILIQNYNASNYDIYRGMLLTSQQIKNRAMKKVFIRLISDMQVSRGEKEIKDAINLFVYTCGTKMAKRLGNIILKAYLHDERVIRALLTLGKTMEDNEEMLEEEKSAATDTILNGLITLPLFVSSLFLGKFVAGPANYFDLQFGRTWTLFLFILITCLVVLSIIIVLMLRSPKNDL
jgi:hypothetical protein